MKRIVVLTLAMALFAGQASAAMYELDVTTAKLFTQLNTPNAANQLFLSIDAPGSFGSAINYSIDPLVFNEYGGTMSGDVGFVGNLSSSQVMQIGLVGDLPGNDGSNLDSFAIEVANDDNNDPWGVRLFLNGVSYIQPDFTTIMPGGGVLLSVSFTPGTVTGFGFEVDDPARTGSDNFHLSVVPVPGAVLLGVLGLMAAGVKLRKFA